MTPAGFTFRAAMAALVLPLCLAIARPHAQQPPRPGASQPGSAELVVIVSVDEPDGRPLRRVSVSLQGSPVDLPRVAVTDDEGRAVFRELPAGNYTLAASRAGYVRTFYGSRLPGRGPGVPLAVIDGQRVPPIRLRVLRGGAISGTVRSASGAPIPGQPVQLTAIRTIDGVRRVMGVEPTIADALNDNSVRTTDDRGMYRFFGLAPGEYLVSAPLLGMMSQEVQPVSAEELRWADAAVAGARSGAPLPPAPAEQARRSYAPVYHPGVADPAAAQAIDLGPSQDRDGIDIVMVMVPTARLSGRLLDDQGRPQPNVAISVRPARTDAFNLFSSIGTASGRTLPDGSFTIQNVRPGQYTVSARATPRDAAAPPAAAPQPGDPAAAAMLAAMLGGGGAGATHWVEEPVTVSGQDLTGLALTLQRGMVVTGRLVYDAATRTPPKDLSQTPVMLMPVPAGASQSELVASMMRGVVNAKVTAAGEFTIAGVPPGQYRINAGVAGFDVSAISAFAAAGGWLVKSVMAAGRDVADAPLDIRPGQDVTDVVVTFTDRPATLAGTVFDPAGRPAPHFPIVVFSTDRSHWTPASRRVRQIRPASNGAFEAVGMPAGEYFVVAVTAVDNNELYDPVFLDQLVPSAFRITIADGERKVQDLKLGGG